MEILHGVERGLSNKEIARELRIEAGTVKNHVHSILEKLQVRRRSQAVRRLRALRYGAAPLPQRHRDEDATLEFSGDPRS
jgi:DNA-binding NarL/FixJ family response regulator